MRSDQHTSIISRAHSLLTADAVHPDQPTGSRAAQATDLAKDFRGELGAWWSKNKMRPSASQQSDGGFPVSAFNSPQSSQPMWSRSRSHSSAATTVSNASAGDYAFASPPRAAAPPAVPPPPGREHLHYRDIGLGNTPAYPPVSSTRAPMAPRRHSSASLPREKAGAELEEQAALDKALEASLRDTRPSSSKASQEDIELQRALAESTQLAMTSSRTEQERSDLARAILESQRQVILEAKQRAAREHVSQKLPPPPAPLDRPPTLDESEWVIQARNEKGGQIWSEAGAHGWLPPGARRAQDDADADEMLEKAIQISLEEDAARKAFEAQFDAETQQPPPLPPRRTRDSQSTLDSYRTAASRPLALTTSPNASSSSEAATRGSPTRPLPPPPPSSHSSNDHSVSSSYASADPSSSHSRSVSFIAPSPPKIFGRNETGTQSPEERPYLGSFKAHLSQLGADGSDKSDDAASFYGSSGFSSEASSPTHPEESEYPAADQLTPPATPSFEVRNPDNGAEQPRPTSNPHLPYTPYLSDYAGRSMSLISEHTEPPASREGTGSSKMSNSSHLPVMDRTESPSNFGDDESEYDAGSWGVGREPSYGSGSERLHVGPSVVLRARLEAEEAARGSSKGSSLLGDSTPPISLDPALGPLASSREILRTPTLAQLDARDSQFPHVLSPEYFNHAETRLTLPQSDAVPLPPAESPFPLAEAPPATAFGDGVRFGFPESCAQDHSCLEDGLQSTAPFPNVVVLTTYGEDVAPRRTFAVEASTWISLLRFLMWYGDTTLQASEDDVATEESRHCDASLSLEFRPNDEGVGVLRLAITILPPNDHVTPQELTLVAPPSFGKGKARAAASPSHHFLLPDHVVLPSRMSSLAIHLYTLRHLANIALSTQPAKDAAPSYHALRSLGSAISSLAAEHSNSHAQDVHREQTKFDEERLLGKLRDRLRRLKPGSGTQGAKLLKPPPVQQAQRTQQIPRRERVLSNADFESVGTEARELDREMRFMPMI